MKGWDASPYLAGLIGEGTEWTHERLAEATGIGQTTISGYAGGTKNLGVRNARRLAAVLGVTIGRLGAPEEAEVSVVSLDRRLQEVQATVAELLRAQARSADRERRALLLLAQLGTRLPPVEVPVEPREGNPPAAEANGG